MQCIIEYISVAAMWWRGNEERITQNGQTYRCWRQCSVYVNPTDAGAIVRGGCRCAASWMWTAGRAVFTACLTLLLCILTAVLLIPGPHHPPHSAHSGNLDREIIFVDNRSVKLLVAGPVCGDEDIRIVVTVSSAVQHQVNSLK